MESRTATLLTQFSRCLQHGTEPQCAVVSIRKVAASDGLKLNAPASRSDASQVQSVDAEPHTGTFDLAYAGLVSNGILSLFRFQICVRGSSVSGCWVCA